MNKKWMRGLFRGLVVVLVVVVLLGGMGMYYLKVRIPNHVALRSFPQVEGELQIPSLNDTVDIYRDEMGVPTIYAETVHDLFFAQGFIHAQERFWQMDTWRHIGSGRVSEMFGESQLETDMFLRTLGWRQTAELEFEALSPQTRQILESNAEGVNAYIGDRDPVEISLEYLILIGLLNRSYEIEPWTPIHSITWGKAMAWDLRGNMDNEIERAVLLSTLSIDQVNELFPPYPDDHPVIVPEIGGSATGQGDASLNQYLDFAAANLAQVGESFALLDAVLGEAGDGIGSNSWAISGELSATGMPLLANDPHLGIQMPSIWFQNNLHCVQKSPDCPFEVGGFSFAGVPGVVIGHNDAIAWGFTNLGPDVMDLYIERVNPDNPDQYEVNGEWVDFETREEIIQAAGGDTYTITVRSTRHGPVISDTFGPLKEDVDLESNPDALPFSEQVGVELPDQYAIALAWTALQPSSPFEAIWGFNTAQNWEEFREATRNFHVPAQNLLYADTAGNIGYQMPGDIPIRANGNGRLPVPGWTDEYEWTGFIPFEELPYVVNPASGYIATANNQVNSESYPFLISTEWAYGYRAARIVELIESAPGLIDIPTIQSMQFDAKSLNAEAMIPVLMEVGLDPELVDIRDHFFRSWQYQETAESQAATVFEWFWSNLLMDTFQDDLPEAYWPGGGSRWYEVMRNITAQPDSDWWDDKATDTVTEDRDAIFARAFAETVEQMQKEYGEDLTDWPAWGELHTATFRNATLGESGIGPIEALFNRGPFTTSGGQGIVNATGWDLGESFEVNWLPSMRMIVDLDNLDNSLTVHTTGESGHAYHAHYSDMSELWAAGEYYPMLWGQDAVMDGAASHLRLVP